MWPETYLVFLCFVAVVACYFSRYKQDLCPIILFSSSSALTLAPQANYYTLGEGENMKKPLFPDKTQIGKVNHAYILCMQTNSRSLHEKLKSSGCKQFIEILQPLPPANILIRICNEDDTHLPVLAKFSL